MRRILCLSLALLLAGCSTTYTYTASDLDSGNFKKQSSLVSQEVPTPTDSQKAGKVVILAHGYTASTYEMQAAESHLESKGYLVSNVLLGGHGTDIADFEKSNWKTWGAPVLKEYEDLVKLGFTDISIVGASTGGALVLEMLGTKRFALAPKKVVLVAPLVYFRDRNIAFAGALEWLGAKSSPKSMGQNATGNWYKDRPIGTLKSLVDLTEIVKGQLRAGIPLDATTKALIIQSDQDPTVDPSSATTVLKGLQGTTSLYAIHSQQHVPIRPPDVDRNWTDTEKAQQQELLSLIDRFIAQ